MWQRNNARQSGPNEAPLGNQRRWGGGDSQPPPPPPPMGGGGGGGGGGGYGRDDRGGGGGRRDDGGYNGGGGGGGYGDNRGGGGYGDNRGGGGGDDRGRSGYDSRGSGGGGGGGGYDSRPSNNGGSNSRFDDRGSGAPRPSPQGSAWDSPSSHQQHSSGPPPPSTQVESGVPGERKRKSRWGNEAAAVGGMPTALTGGVAGKDLESYAVQLRLDEIARSLRSGLVVPPDGSRSPSPPPTYDSHGRRTNTREVRYRKKLEDERMRLVDRQIKLDPNFKPPTEYLMAKRQNGGRPQDKVYIPVKEFPEINFFGLLVGPRGNSLKNMERESGAKISIRGKGSVKEGKGRPGGGFEDDENEELHCLVTGESEEKVQRCVKLINSVIEIAASVPEGQNDHKRNQLRELAQLNGTLRDDENQVCQNCGGIGHRKYECPEQKNWTAGIICRTCGGAGHMARDCTQGKGQPFNQSPGGPPGGGGIGGGPVGVDQVRAQQFDSEYASLMAELGETSSVAPLAGGGTSSAGFSGGDTNGGGAAPWNNNGGGGNMQGVPLDDKGEKIPPWRMPGNWNPPNQERQQRPPQAPQPQHANYTGTSVGYSSFPQANMAAAAYGGYPQMQMQNYGYQYPQA